MHDSGKNMFQKCLSVLLALVLIFSAMPITVSAFTDDLVGAAEFELGGEVDDYYVQPELPIEYDDASSEIVEVVNDISPATVIWSLQTDAYVQNLPIGQTALSGTSMLNPAGSSVSAVAHPVDSDARSLEVTGRTADWHGLQILRPGLEAAGMNVGNTYNIVVTGRAIMPPAGGQMVLRQANNPWNNLSALVGVSPANPNFTINWTFNPEQANLVGQDMRIQTPTGASATMSFIVDDIIITRTIVGAAAYTLEVNGEPGETTTTEITLNFLRDISPDLELSHITFNPRTTGATVTGLRRVAANEYVLEIADATRWGYVEVVIDHPDVQTAARTVMIYHEDGYFRPNAPLRPYFPWVHDPDFRGLMPLEEMLNDPFQFFVTTDGQSGGYGEVIPNRVVTEADWEHRRAEIRDLVMYYYAGYMWPTTIDNVTVNTTSVVRGTAANNINITVNEYRLDGTPVIATANIATGVWLPTYEQLRANGFYETGGPIIIGTGHTLSVASRDAALARGIAVAVVPGPGDARPHAGMYTSLFPHNPNITEYNSGAMMIHAWNVSRFLDALEIMQDEWRVNPNMSVTIGNSFQGKRAMFAAVMDERVAIAAPHESGGDGGMAPFRGSHAGRIHFYWSDGVNRPHSWHETPRAGNAGRRAQGPIVDLLWSNLPHEESTWLAPFDTHMIAALQAGPVQGFDGPDVPGRVFLSLETANFGTWTGWSVGRTVAEAAGEVFSFLGYEDYMVYFMKQSTHAIHNSDFPVIFAILDYQFGNNGRREANQVYVPNILGAALPGLWDGGLSALGRSPVEVDSFFMPWTRPGVHLLYTENQLVSEGLPATIVAHTDAPVVELILWSHGDGNRLWGVANPPVELDRWSTTVVDGVATFNLTGDEVRIGRYELRTSDGELDDRSVFFQGIDVRTALRNTATSDNIGSGAALFGFTSRINPDVQVYTTNAAGVVTSLNTHTTPNVGNTWVAPFGIRVPSIPGTGNYRFFTFRNLQLEAVPGFTFEMSYQENINLGGWPNPDIPVIWNASPAVQHIGPYPHFRPGGTGLLPNDTHMGYSANRTTDFEATILSHEGVGSFDDELGVWTELTAWVIEFSEPMNPRDFGIGFDFSTDFTLEWSNNNEMLTIVFNNFQPELNPADTYLNMHITRLRDARPATGNSAVQMARVHNDLISYSLPGPLDLAPAYDITRLSIGGIAGAIDQEARTITFTVPEEMIFHHEVLGAQLRGSITDLEAISDALLFYVTGHDWPYSLLRLGDWVGVGTGNTVRVEGGLVYTIILNLPGLECKVIAYGQFTNQAGVDGLAGSEWRLCEDGTLEIDEGFINWTLYQGPWAAYVDEITDVVITGPIRAGASLRSLFRDFQVTEIEGLTYFDTSDTRNMENMFRNASAIVVLNLSSFDTSNVTNMQRMFTNMRALRELTLGEEFVFVGNAGLPVLAHGDGYTGMWQNGEFIFTSAQLMSQFDGATMAGTFVWQVWEESMCVVVVNGRFVHQSAAQGGVAGAVWRLCENGRLEIDEGFINWTLYNGPWHAHRNDITAIVITGPITAGPSLRSLFRDLNYVTEIEGLTYFDTSRTTSMENMFRTSTGITELDLSSFDSSNVTNMQRMFTNMHALEYVNFGEYFTPADNSGLPAHLRP